MTGEYVLHERPDLDDPVLVMALAGWIDAGVAAQTAMEALVTGTAARTIATFDPDRYLDYRARRPVMQLREGVNAGLVWPSIELRVGTASDGRHVLLLTGHEPDSAWHSFVASAADLAVNLGARLAVGLGAYPFAAPHTRPSRLAVTCSTPELAASLPYQRSTLDVPAGVQAALERAFAEREVPAVGLWAQVPHYVANAPYPGASVALLDGVVAVAGVAVDSGAVHRAAEVHREQVDALMANSAEHLTLLRQLEQAWDAESGTISGAEPGTPLPTGEELAEELERFLRDQG